LTARADVLTLFSMAVNTLGEAFQLGWRVRAQCVARAITNSGRDVPLCNQAVELDMKTLVWTRGGRIPLDQLASRLR
jgi:hypothetical protein